MTSNQSEEPSGGGIPPVIEPEPARAIVARWRWMLHLCLLAAYPLVIGGLALVGPRQVEPALSNTVRGVLTVSVVELSLFAVVFGIAWFCSRAPRPSLYLAEPFRWRMLPLGLVYSVGLRVGIAVIIGVIAGGLVATRVISTDELQELASANRPEVEALVDINALKQSPMYMFLNVTLVSFVVAGLREELWRAGVLAGLRALWPKRFNSIGGQLLGVGVAAVIFGLGHLAQGVLAVFLTGVLGFFLGAIIVFHKSIWPAVLAHGLFNATTFLILPLASKYLPDMFTWIT